MINDNIGVQYGQQPDAFNIEPLLQSLQKINWFSTQLVKISFYMKARNYRCAVH